MVRVIKSRRLRWVGHLDKMGDGRTAFKMLTGTSARMRSLRMPKRRWEDNIRMDLKEIDINARNWVHSAQDRDYWRAVVNAELDLRIP
jgi:hypothetical protein